MAAMAAMSSKKNFDFKMSKKVAELTQVVHMLFTRNHEKEVEVEALKTSYEEEISIVIRDAQTRIQNIQNRLEQLEAAKNSQDHQNEIQAREQCQRHEAELNAKIQHLEVQLHEEKTESQHSRDLLIRTQRDLQDLRHAHAGEVRILANTSEEHIREIARLKNEIVSLAKDVRDKDSLLDSKGELLRTHEKLRRELEQLRSALQVEEKSRNDLAGKNRHLESEVKALKKELAKRINNERHSAKTAPPVASGYTGEYNEEIEQLRKQVLRYKMELSNRENNFNRVFSEKQPITTDNPPARRFGRGGVSQEGMQNVMRINREKTYAGSTLGASCSEEIRELETPRNAISAAGRLARPGIGSDKLLPHLMENKLHRLVKPRPLPKELLSGKASAGAR